ncbi:MAG TPA: hypothetical protein VF187_05970 [Gemmatimonadales bacterium]
MATRPPRTPLDSQLPPGASQQFPVFDPRYHRTLSGLTTCAAAPGITG